jgi:acyl-CoA synthetase (AMP-forming)/AMP-acid ligase II
VTPADLLARELARDGTRPFLTWYDDASGDRVELSVATTANWVAKTANYLEAELDVEAEEKVAISEPLHWLSPLCALAIWTIGADVVGGAAGDGVEIPGADLAAFQRSVLAQPDALLTAGRPTEVPEPPISVPAGARLLSTAGYDTAHGLMFGLLAPLAAGGSVVVVANADPQRLPARCAAERVTHTVGVDVTDLPRLD